MTQAECQAQFNSIPNTAATGQTFSVENVLDAAAGASYPDFDIDTGPCILVVQAFPGFAVGNVFWTNNPSSYPAGCDPAGIPAFMCICASTVAESPPISPPASPPPPSPSPPVPIVPDFELVHALEDGQWQKTLQVVENVLTPVYYLDLGERGLVVVGDTVVYVNEATETCANDAASKPYDDPTAQYDHGGVVHLDGYGALYVHVKLPQAHYRLCYLSTHVTRRQLQIVDVWTETNAFLDIVAGPPPSPSRRWHVP